MRINIPGMEMINIDEIIERAPRPKGRRINVTPKKKTKAAVKPKAKVKAKAKPKRKPRRISTPRTFDEEINLENINLPEIGSILPRPTRVDTTPKPKPKPPVNLEDALISKRPPVLGSIPGAGGIETINIPGVGQIQLPNVQSGGVETPPNIFDDSAKTETDSIAFPNPFANETDPNLSELDRLKNQYDRLTGMRFFRDPGPGHFNKIKELAQQIYGLDNTFESPYLQTETQPVETQPETAPTAPTPTGSYESSYIDWLESEPQKPTVRPARKLPGGGPAYKKAQKKYREDLANWKGSKPTKDSFLTGETVATSGVPVETQPVETQPTPPPKPPPSFEGYVPRNILGASFDPKDVSAQQKMVADARARQTPGANIQGGGYLTYDNPILGNKQTQFGGYGQPMPTAPLMNYAGLSSPITYSTPAPDPDAQPGGPPPPQIPSFDV